MSKSNPSNIVLETPRKTALRRALLAWFESNRRKLPWRESGAPYAVWVSEIMCQQTRVDVVRDYFVRWMKAFPDLQSLAKAEEADVLRIWQGLGYYSRARRLQQGAVYVVQELDGQMPETSEELQKIPGIGPYSAGAIASIAFGQAVPAVDGNVIRVLTRLFALPGDPNQSALKKELWSLAGQLVDPGRPGAFNQAVMELGALVCTPRKPSCIACPWRKQCEAYAQGTVAQFPALPKKAPPTERHMALVLLRHRGSYALLRLGRDAPWWAGLDAFPFVEASGPEALVRAATAQARAIAALARPDPLRLTPVKHTVTRFKVHLTPYVFEAATRGAQQAGLSWIPWAELRQASLPAPHRVALQAIEELEADPGFRKNTLKN